ncbi:MAG: type I-G CRISPR-associated helicase/endonuclease Cas3g [Pyrinomonadaceae bacterium]
MNELDFSSAFKALTGFDPLRWQIRFYERLRVGQVPRTCDLPTGLGKTSVIPIWLIALASQLSSDKTPLLPRRLIYIVNRRTVVDQATTVAEKLRRRILGQEIKEAHSTNTLEDLRHALAKSVAIATDGPLAISTLRGELADNEEWKVDPARPAIIIGTIDMIGSKLLFSGYGDGYRMRPHHAGLIGQDTLIVHDEAHLTPAFGTLLRAIAEEQKRCGEPRRIRVLELSATVSKTEGDDIFSLESDDETDSIVPLRLDANKSLFFPQDRADQLSQETADASSAGEGGKALRAKKNPLSQEIIECALKYQSNAFKVLIYVGSPEAAKQIVRGLKERLEANRDNRVALLTGTIRGHERDLLVRENPVYRALMDHESKVDQTFYFVSTSAGEVGIDLDADHMISDLTTLDSMIQRLGRVNRFGGESRTAVIDVVVEVKKEEGKPEQNDEDVTPAKDAEARTKLALEKLPKRQSGGYDASPRALRNLVRGMSDEERDQSFAAKPPIVPVTDILLDAWALTSIREALPGRPEVASYLHGLTADPPETYVAWRSEVKLLAQADVPPKMLRAWFQHCRIEARERLRDRTDRIAKELKKIAKRQGESQLPCVMLDERGNAELSSIQNLLKRDESALHYRTVVLPIEAGGLTREGVLDGGEDEVTGDVAETDGKRARILVRCVGNTYWHEQIINSQISGDEEYISIERAAARVAKASGKVVSQIIPLTEPLEGDEDEREERYLLLLVEPRQAATDTPESAGYDRQPTLDRHLEQAASVADRIAHALLLEDSLKEAVVAAARWHDRGKDRRRWQRAIFNNDPTLVFAKSGQRGMDWRRLGGYRHEFGSLLDAGRNGEVLSLQEADLVLHLIAAHHGRARPHFDPDGWDMERYKTSENEEAAYEAMRRYGRLQQRFGRWSLAWLESLVRCADVIASRQAQENTSIPQEESE